MDGRSEADAIAVEQVARALAACASLSAGPDGRLSRRAEALNDALSFMAGPDAPTPRALGPRVCALARHAAGRLADDAGADPSVGGADFDAAMSAYDAMDAVVTALGGKPELLAGDDDWDLPPEAGPDLVPAEGLAETAGTAAMFARDALTHAGPGPSSAMMRRDAGLAVASALCLRAALADGTGCPVAMLEPVVSGAGAALSRLGEAVAAWRASGTGRPGGSALEGVARAASSAASVLSELDAEIRGAGPVAGAHRV